jgi:hypothetical protein
MPGPGTPLPIAEKFCSFVKLKRATSGLVTNLLQRGTPRASANPTKAFCQHGDQTKNLSSFQPNITQFPEKTRFQADICAFPLKALKDNPNWSHRLHRQPEPCSSSLGYGGEPRMSGLGGADKYKSAGTIRRNNGFKFNTQ